MPHSIPLPPGTTLKRDAYRLEQNIGRGGMALVYRASGPDGSLCAIKECYDAEYAVRSGNCKDIIARTDVKNAARIHAHQCKRTHEEVVRFSLPDLQHPGLVRLIESFDQFGTAYMVMPLLAGVPLNQAALWPEAKNTAWVLAVLQQLAEALAVLHRHQLIHRDLKPDNVMITGDRNTPQPVLLDTGAARGYSDAKQLHTGIATDFGAPEIFSAAEARRFGAPGPASDCFAMAGLAYWLLSGHKPPSYLTRVGILESGSGRDPLTRPSNMRIEVWNILQKSLLLNVSEREASTTTLVRTLAAALVGAPIQAGEPSIDATPAPLLDSPQPEMPIVSIPSAPVQAGNVEYWLIALALTLSIVLSLFILVGSEYGLLAVLSFLIFHFSFAALAVRQGTSSAQALWPIFNLCSLLSRGKNSSFRR